MPGFVVNSIGGVRSRGGGLNPNAEYMYKYTWNIPELFRDTDGQVLGSFSQSQGLASPIVHLRDATLPVFSVNKEVVMSGSVEYKFAKSVSFDDVKVSWYDTSGLLGIMQAWRNMVWNPDDGLKVAEDYKKSTEILHYLPHDGSVANSYKLVNSWPSVIRHGELTYTESEVNLVEVTITYDWSEHQLAVP